MNLTATFDSAENRFRQVLEDFFVTIYHEKSLISHGIEHHRRVWKNARQLSCSLSTGNKIFNETFADNLIIVCFMHDIGMAIDPGFIHGRHSKALCIRFLREQNLQVEDFTDVLETIENHDNKEYNGTNEAKDLLLVLSVADDLDAFGFTGIYRYSEIYLERKIDFSSIGHKIRENARKRFDNFEKYFGFSEELYEVHKLRYELLDSFFEKYNEQLDSYNFNTQKPGGYCGVVNLFSKMASEKIPLSYFLETKNNYSYDPVIAWFFEGLIAEMKDKNMPQRL